MKFSIFQDSRQGPRLSNQDRVAYAYSKEALLAVLADGMGGHQHGDVAAQFAVEILTESFQRMAMPTLASPARFLEEYIHQLHASIERHALLADMMETPCTTIVAAIVQHNTLYCAHVGDSRLYHFRDGQLLFCTEDHSKVRLLCRQGVISEAQMQHHPERNLIYNCIGGPHQPQVELATKRHLQPGDIILLCSDGFWTELDHVEIIERLYNARMTEAMPDLLDRVESRAGSNGDNTSAIVIHWEAASAEHDIISTDTMTADSTSTSIDLSSRRTPEGLNDEDHDTDIEYAIAEIQAALARTAR